MAVTAQVHCEHFTPTQLSPFLIADPNSFVPSVAKPKWAVAAAQHASNAQALKLIGTATSTTDPGGRIARIIKYSAPPPDNPNVKASDLVPVMVKVTDDTDEKESSGEKSSAATDSETPAVIEDLHNEERNMSVDEV